MSTFSPLLSGAFGIIVTTVISFILLTLVASYYRFMSIIKLAENTQPEEMGTSASNIIHIQIIRYLARCNRKNTSFSLGIIKIKQDAFKVQIQSPIMQTLKSVIREEDTVCVYDESTIALLLEMEPEDSEIVFTRILKFLATQHNMLKQDIFRAGISSYPEHGSVEKKLLTAALEGLEATTEENPIIQPKLTTLDFEQDENEEEDVEVQAKEKRKEHKQRMIDPLTGVLKPSAISVYMQRMMGDIRYKKKKAALFCIGLNKMEHISQFHGEETADNVLIGVSEILQNSLRVMDLIGRHEKYAFLVLMETDTESAETIGKRITTLIQQGHIVSNGKRIKVNITLGVSTYPEHGKNLHQIYEAAQKVLDYNRTNDIRAYALYDPEIHARTMVKPMHSIKSIHA